MPEWLIAALLHFAFNQIRLYIFSAFTFSSGPTGWISIALFLVSTAAAFMITSLLSPQDGTVSGNVL